MGQEHERHVFQLRGFDRGDEPAVLRALEARDRADFGDPVIRRAIPPGEWRDREFDPANAPADPAFIPTPWPSFHDREFADPQLAPELSRVARRGAAIAGYATCRQETSDHGYVEILGVVEDERRRGLGRALLLAVFDAFAAAGLTRGRLMVASDNPRARALYESVGMVPAHELVVLERAL